MASIASITSVSHSSSLILEPPVNPYPAYITASAAAQIVISDYRSHYFESTDNQSSLYIVVMVPASLTLINAFLDYLLYNFLASAQSISMASLRPAIQEVLKPQLAKEAIAGLMKRLKSF